MKSGWMPAKYQSITATKYYYTSDQINSTRIITDNTGAVVYSAVFDPYGGLQKQWVKTYQPSLKFSGKEREARSELDYFGARYYGHKQYRFPSLNNKTKVISHRCYGFRTSPHYIIVLYHFLSKFPELVLAHKFP